MTNPLQHSLCGVTKSRTNQHIDGRRLNGRRIWSQLLRGLAICGTVTIWLGAAMTAAADETAAPAQQNEPHKTALASQGKARQQIVIAAGASERTRAAAATLADYLGRISGAKFEIKEGDGSAGIALGTAADFSATPEAPKDWSDDPRRREDYLLRTHDAGLWMIGNTELAVEHAVWDLLYQIGYRQFFPGEHWEVVPKRPELAIAVDRFEQPDYHARRIWYGYGPWNYAAEPYRQWCAKNRAVSGVELRSGHAYDGIIARNKAAFAEHPEYLGLVKGERKSTKFCIGNPAVRQLVIDDALAQLRKNPQLDSISVDPSDGLNWCECEDCQALGSITDRAVALANAVAEAVHQHKPGTIVGMYAYSGHSPPPSIRVHPQVVISVATAFIHGGYTVEELMRGWQSQGATLGIREYYSVHTWDRDLPGRARGGNLQYIRTTLPQFHALGARYFSSESSDNWGPNGLGYYIAARILWDVDEAYRVDELVDDFLSTAFGDAKEPMAKFYQLLDTSERPLLSNDLLGRMYRLLRDARAATNDDAVHKRIDDLLLYTRYVELFMEYSNARNEARQQALEALIRHTYRMRTTMMVHAKAVYRDVDARDRSVTIPEEARWQVPEDQNPWKDGRPFSRDELAAIEADGIANRQVRDFEPVAYSRNLRPAAEALNLPEVATGSTGGYHRGVRTYYAWLPGDGKQTVRVPLTGKAGIIYTNRGPAKVSLMPFDGELFPEDQTEDNPPEYLSTAEVPPDKEEHALVLEGRGGLNLLQISDRAAGTQVTWEDSLGMTLESSVERPAALSTRWTLYFYVPRGTQFIGGFADGPGRLVDPAGKLAHTFSGEAGYFSIPVPEGQDGKLWKFDRCAGKRILMTVPPYLARNEKELLLPVEVIERDRQ